MKTSTELDHEFSDFLKDAVKPKNGSKDPVVDALKKALEGTTPERPGDPRDYREKKRKVEDLQWW